MARRLKMLLNLGLDDRDKYGLPECCEDEVVSVHEDQAHILVNVLKCAKDYDADEEAEHEEEVRAFDESVYAGQIAQEQAREQVKEGVRAKMVQGKRAPVRRATRTTEPEEEATEEVEESPVNTMSAQEAIDHIGRMRSKDRLQEIATTDPRSTVTDAANRRLSELG